MHGSYPALNGHEFFDTDETDLVQDDHVRERNLLFGFVAILQARQNVLGVDDAYDGVEAGTGRHQIVHEVCLGERRRVSDAQSLVNERRPRCHERRHRERPGMEDQR